MDNDKVQVAIETGKGIIEIEIARGPAPDPFEGVKFEPKLASPIRIASFLPNLEFFINGQGQKQG